MASALLALLLVLAFFGLAARPNQMNVRGRGLPSTPLTTGGGGDSCRRYRPWVWPPFGPQPPNTPGSPGGGRGGFPPWGWPPFNVPPFWPQPPNTPVPPRGGGGGGGGGFPSWGWPPFNMPPFRPQPPGPPGWGFPPFWPLPPTGGSGCMGECDGIDMTCPAKCYKYSNNGQSFSFGCSYDCNQCTVSCS